MKNFTHLILLIACSLSSPLICEEKTTKKKSVLSIIKQKLNKKAQCHVKKITFPYMNSKQAEYYVDTMPGTPTPRPPDYV